jgi:predicted transcriptional regulator of viral defense system/very-short-patch-repair endonuclease
MDVSGQTLGVDGRIAELAGRQHGVVARRQLEGLGVGREAIEVRLRNGRLHRLYRGVYAVGHRALSKQGRWMAAVFAGGPGAVLSHLSAAALWGIRGSGGGSVHVTTARKSRSSGPIRRHCSLVPEDERGVVDGIPATTVPRTIFDLAAIGTTDQVESLVRESEYRQLHDRLSLFDLLERYPRRRGAPRVRAVLERIEGLPAGQVSSPLEERFLLFLRRHGLPLPRLNDWIVVGDRRFRVDCHWPGTGQIVELDSWQAHGTRASFRSDRARDRILRVAGYSVTRISWAQLDDEPVAVAADLRTLIYKRS